MSVQKFHIKKNDLVMVMNGKEKGKSGRILKVLPEKEKVIIEKINFIKTPFSAPRSTKTRRDFGKGGPPPCLQCDAPL